MQDKDIKHRFQTLENSVNNLRDLVTKSNAPRENDGKSPEPQPQTEEKYEGAGGETLGISYVEPPPAHSEHSHQRKKNALPWYQNWPGFWKRVFEVIGVLGLVFYCYVSYQSWYLLRHNFETDEQAWIKPTFTFNSDKIFAQGDEIVRGKMFDGDAVVRITNSGKSPILRTRTDVWVEILDHDTAPTFDWGHGHSISATGLIFPGDYIDTEHHRFHGDGSGFDPTEAELKALREGADYVAVYGYTKYRDNFGSHWTRYCVTWRYIDADHPPIMWTNSFSCIEVNAVGDGDDPLVDIPKKKQNTEN